MINHEQLLRKYISHIVNCEGIDYISFIERPEDDQPRFTAEEVEELKRLSGWDGC